LFLLKDVTIAAVTTGTVTTVTITTVTVTVFHLALFVLADELAPVKLCTTSVVALINTTNES
jgi:hypothetical protein